MKINKTRSTQFNNELDSAISRIESVLDFYEKNPERLTGVPQSKNILSNRRALGNYCNEYFRIRTKFSEKYGFDFSFSMKESYDENHKEILIAPIELSNGIEVSSELLRRYINLSQKVKKSREKLGEQY